MGQNYLFIDDSGPKDWRAPYSRDFVLHPPSRTNQNLSFWRDNYFVLAGVHVDSDEIAKLNPVIDGMKKKYFGTKYVELHSADLRFPHTRKKKYLDKYGIGEDELREFVDDFWYGIFTSYKIQSIAIVIDKRYYKNARYSNKTPLDLAAFVLFERNELHPKHNCIITFDQMDSQIRAKTGNQGKILQIANTRVELDGMELKKYHHISVGFANSATSNFLQLADMVAYNVWRQFVEYGDEWEKHSPEGEHRILPTYKYFERISNSFYTKNSKLSGIGLVKVPDPYSKKKSWKLLDGS